MLKFDQRYFKLSAEKGNPMGQIGLGSIYDDSGDHENAFHHIELAATQGYSNGQNNLAWRYQNGIGVEKDLDKAIVWYKKAIDQGLPSAMNNLGTLYLYEKDPRMQPFRNLAAELFKSSANLGWKNGMFTFGQLCEDQKKYTTMMEYYEKAAAKGYAPALRSIGWIYQHGQFGFQKDVEKALEYYKKAEKKMDEKTFLALGEIYQRGDGVTQDLKLARNYYSKCADMGNDIAKEKLQHMEGRTLKQNQDQEMCTP